MAYFERKQLFLHGENREKRQIDIEDSGDAQEFIRDAIEAGTFPIISVPKQYADAARKGLKAHTTWIGEKYLVGTIGRDPYLPDGEERCLFRIMIRPEQVAPRFTSADHHFHGVVIFREGQISSSAMIEITR